MQLYMWQYLTEPNYCQISALNYPALMSINDLHELSITLRDRTEAPLYGPSYCSAHVRSRSLYDCTTAVSPRYADPSTFVRACSNGLLQLRRVPR